uniref:Uncharacterized protein n=1 Tax=Arundo donax TaxID=35708 RepID=A0A0A8ZT08_ARUDO
MAPVSGHCSLQKLLF